MITRRHPRSIALVISTLAFAPACGDDASPPPTNIAGSAGAAGGARAGSAGQPSQAGSAGTGASPSGGHAASSGTAGAPGAGTGGTPSGGTGGTAHETPSLSPLSRDEEPKWRTIARCF